MTHQPSSYHVITITHTILFAAAVVVVVMQRNCAHQFIAHRKALLIVIFFLIDIMIRFDDNVRQENDFCILSPFHSFITLLLLMFTFCLQFAKIFTFHYFVNLIDSHPSILSAYRVNFKIYVNPYHISICLLSILCVVKVYLL